MEKIDNVKFARTWFHEASKRFPEEADPVMRELIRFFAAYVAFNSLYSEFKREEDSDRHAINSFLRKTQNRFGRYSLKNAYEAMDFDHREIQYPVSMFSSNSQGWVDSYHDENSDNTLRVFQRIHTVRCNLFHGLKDPYSRDQKRDLWLISECRTILEDFLGWYFSKLDRCSGPRK